MKTHGPNHLIRCIKYGQFLFLLLTASILFSQVSVEGEFKQWHTVSIIFTGPNLSEQSTDNPFLNYRLNVTFTSPKGKEWLVPGFYAADGNAAETSADSGNKWMVRFTPNETGLWNYSTSFMHGADIAINLDSSVGTPTHFDGARGSFNIAASNKTAPDNRANGRLNYVGKRYLQFEGSRKYFLKAGADSPENLLAFADFDNTPNVKNWSPHVQDWLSGDPVWQGIKGKGLIGAINYLSSKGMNAFSFNPLTLEDFGYNKYNSKDVWPFSSSDLNLLQDSGNASDDSRLRYDVSKLEQWEIVFRHADSKGMYLHFKTQDRSNLKLLDDGALGTQRKLYYRELIARFGHHLALNWNLGEEFHLYDANLIGSYASYIKAVDPYDHHIVIHSYPNSQERLYRPILGPGYDLTGASMQIFTHKARDVMNEWIAASKNSGKPWVVAYDEQAHWDIGVAADEDFDGNKGTVPDNRDDIRHRALWNTLMVGGAGVEYFFGGKTGENDYSAQNWRSRDSKWEDAKIALDFFHTYLEFWGMETNDHLTSTAQDYCLANPGKVYAIYLPKGGTTNLNLNGVEGTFSVRWFNPRTGGPLEAGSKTQIGSDAIVNIGMPPEDTSLDWVALVQKIEGTTIAVEGVVLSPETASLKVGEELSLNVQILPTDATDKTVFWYSDNTDVVTVDQEGNINALAEGTATVRVTTSDGGFMATTTISVTSSAIKVTGISLDPSSLEMEEGEDHILKINIVPSNATNKSVSWSTDAPQTVVVDQNGKISAQTPGTALITVESLDGGFKAVAEITVNEVSNLPNTIKTTSFTLVDASSNTDLLTLENGMVIDLEMITGKLLNIRANTDPSAVGSVSLTLNGPITHTSVENVAPYALFGDNSGNYRGKALNEGNYILQGVPYSGPRKSGTIGEILVLGFAIKDKEDKKNEAPIAKAQASPSEGTAPLRVSFNADKSEDDNGISSYFWDFGDGGTSAEPNPLHTYTSPKAYTATLTVTDSAGLTHSETVVINVKDPEPSEPSIDLVFVDAARDSDLFDLIDEMQIAFSEIQNKSINLRASFPDRNVGSVQFKLSGPIGRTQTENVSPYALFGDYSGNYRGKILQIGVYQLEVTAFGLPNLGGTVLASKKVSFSVVDQGANRVEVIEIGASEDVLGQAKGTYSGSKIRIFPIPSSETISVVVSDPRVKASRFYIYNLNGTLVKKIENPDELRISPGVYEINLDGISDGVYILKTYMDSFYAFQYRFIVAN